jgi:amidohydrolase
MNRLRERVTQIYDFLHQTPEPGFEEFKTAAFLAEQLQLAGYSVQTGIGGTGVAGVLDSGVPAAVYDEDLVQIAREAIEAVLGPRGVLGPEITPGGEDFQYFTNKKPSIKAAYIGLSCDLEPGLHHPDMHFNLAALPIGVRILKELVTRSFSLEVYAAENVRRDIYVD